MSVEQLWDLNMTDLAALAKALKNDLGKNDKDEELSFLDDAIDTLEYKTSKLRFDIVKDIYNTKKEAIAAARNEIEKKSHNQRILQLIANKQLAELEGKTIEELEAMLK